jgi:hypothetical protein
MRSRRWRTIDPKARSLTSIPELIVNGCKERAEVARSSCHMREIDTFADSDR